jgi:hypothetical protein
LLPRWKTFVKDEQGEARRGEDLEQALPGDYLRYNKYLTQAARNCKTPIDVMNMC